MLFSVTASDGAELAKIQKVKVLRNDKREGEFGAAGLEQINSYESGGNIMPGS